MAKIENIENRTFKHTTWGSAMEGYVITLEGGHQIQMGIDNQQHCCEQWGYLSSEDDLVAYIGSEYLGLDIVNEALSTVTSVPPIYEGSVMFVNVNTSRGTFQFVAYNEHNGYYGHHAVVVVSGVTVHEETL